jgi:protein-S-isoprenylcysteine O-methyltransferase Ste14
VSTLSTPVRVLFIATAVAWAVVELRQSAVRRAGATHEDRGSRAVLSVTVGVGALLGTLATHRTPDLTIEPRRAAELAALLLLWGGVGLRVWSFHTLGRYFTFTVQTSRDQPVIANGPYRVVRHPSYTGLLLAILGVAVVALGNWLGVVILEALAVVAVVYRIHVEEGALLRTLGDDYRDYARSRKRLVPFVW